MRDLAVLFLHLLATVARLAGPGGARSVVAESVLVKHQLLILNRSRTRSPNLRASDRVVAGLSVSNSSSGCDWELDQVPAVGEPTHMVQIGRGDRLPTAEGQRRVALH